MGFSGWVYQSSDRCKRAWIGLSKIKEGNMTWVNNTPLNKGFWETGEPNDENKNENCVEIRSRTESLPNNWNDLACSETIKWICEK
ncbi:putative C-type lectin domain family 4 member E-like [Triplophysa rosa]|uniref:C-type lectin domain family 4 member E-like n=1 Tax=Triplophysa rosa TaxID=992332 RepID=A0A9W7WZ91_TRIRA|nr:putative C-type lectin domain family 4 member E-like [Triplophysa rosa]